MGTKAPKKKSAPKAKSEAPAEVSPVAAGGESVAAATYDALIATIENGTIVGIEREPTTLEVRPFDGWNETDIEVTIATLPADAEAPHIAEYMAIVEADFATASPMDVPAAPQPFEVQSTPRWSRTDTMSTCPLGFVAYVRDGVWAVTVGGRDTGTVGSRDEGEKRVEGK